MSTIDLSGVFDDSSQIVLFVNEVDDGADRAEVVLTANSAGFYSLARLFRILGQRAEGGDPEHGLDIDLAEGLTEWSQARMIVWSSLDDSHRLGAFQIGLDAKDRLILWSASQVEFPDESKIFAVASSKIGDLRERLIRHIRPLAMDDLSWRLGYLTRAGLLVNEDAVYALSDDGDVIAQDVAHNLEAAETGVFGRVP
jgi:hypothetical protein